MTVDQSSSDSLQTQPRPRNLAWVLITAAVLGLALLAIGLVLLAGITFVGASALPFLVSGPILGQVAVLAVVLGGGGACAAFGGLLFGWLGGSPYVPIGSHRSVIGTTVLALVIGGLIGIGFLRVAGASGADQSSILTTLAATFYGTLLVMVYLQGVRSGLLTRENLGIGLRYVVPGVNGGIVTAVALLVFGALNGLVLTALGIEQPQAENLRWLIGRPFEQVAVALFAIAVLAPTVEELFFRGYVFNAYLRSKGTITAYVATSLAFSLIHGLPALFVAIFGTGLILAYSYRRTGTIIAPIFAHVANNAFAFAALIGSQR